METLKSTLPVIAMLAAMTIFAACSGWINNRSVMTEAPEEHDMPPGLVRANIETTDYTAIVQILKGRVEGRSFRGRPAGYVNHVYRARVVETLKGPRHETISFTVMADSDIDLRLPEYPVIVSLCGSGGDTMYVPDNGYLLPAAASVTAAARAFARQAKKGAPLKSVCSE